MSSTNIIVEKLKKYLWAYGTNKSMPLDSVMSAMISFISGYNHKKYWKRRSYVIDPSKRNFLLKLYYYFYIKRVDSKHLSSFGCFINSGANFSTPPSFLMALMV